MVYKSKMFVTNNMCVFIALSLASYDCEPPDSSYEKHHYKQLKSVLRAYSSTVSDKS